MSGPRWADDVDEHDDAHDDTLEIRHVHPYEAVKPYRCPGCDHVIPTGLGHEVVVPLAAPSDRRHWHTGCWYRAARRM